MFEFILGIFLVIVPFVLLGLFLDKKRGFVSILFFLCLFFSVLFFLTQLLGIFTYWVVISLFALTDMAILYFYFFIKKKGLKIPKIDWILVVVVLIAVGNLYQVHYNYTGKINLAVDTEVGYHEVKNMKYVYPYFSDEWYAVSLIKETINSQSLAFKNPLDNSFFLNLQVFFHSFVAGIILILGLDPLTQYVLVSLAFNVLIIVLVYIFLRIRNVPKLVSAISSLSILYITCGANLPGIWNFIPVHMGIIFSLFGFCFLALNSIFMVVLSLVLVFLFYPPISIFLGMGFIVYLFEKFYKKDGKFLKIFSYSLIVSFVAIPLAYLILMVSPLAGFIEHLISRVFYSSFYGPNLTNINFYNIIPLPIILFALFGMIFVFKNKKWFFSIFLLGLIFWIFYSFTTKRFLIEFERVVFITSIIIAIISGFGIEQFKNYLNQKYKNINYKVIKYVEVFVVLLFLLFIPFYTQRENWKTITLINIYNRAISYPKAPANNYLTEEDLKIFENIKNKRFLSLGWKGTVISTATDNYPIVAKEGTLSLGEEITVREFLDASCEIKKRIAEKRKIDYIYLHNFSCPGFKKIDESKEKLVLYEVS
jgi:hypothetical protein